MKTSKFCAGHAFAGRKVESIHPASEIATTGTPGALTAKPATGERVLVDLWCGFALLVACFVIAGVEDRIRGG